MRVKIITFFIYFSVVFVAIIYSQDITESTQQILQSYFGEGEQFTKGNKQIYGIVRFVKIK